MSETTSIDRKTFRTVLGRFATGVTVVTTMQGSQRVGITVNAFTSLSLDPPLVLICIDRTSRVHDALLESGSFAVNFLAANQANISTCFASNSDRRYRDFGGATSHPVATGAPIIDGCLGYVDCKIVNTFPGGDHTIIIGHVEALDASDDAPLLYYRGQYATLSEPDA